MGQRPGRRLGSLAWVLAHGALLAACAADPDDGTAADSQAPVRPSAGALPECDHGAGDAVLGVFRETQRERVDEYEAWLGCRVDYVVDFPSRDTWLEVANPRYLLDEWEGSDRRLVLSVAMLPLREEADFASGARGEYDRYFRELAERLVSRGRQDTIVRIGWEFNLKNSAWYTEDVESFRAYWDRIVAAMRSVPGQQLEFTWNPAEGGVDAVPYYPGDDVVDHIGVDIYDSTGAPGTYPYPDRCDNRCRLGRQSTAWNEVLLGGQRGLRFWAAFAAERDKPLVLPEWGLWERPDGTGGGDNAYFVRRMYEFISDPTHNVAYHAYFEFDGDDGAHRLMTTFDDVGEVYRELFGPAPEATPASPATPVE